MRNLTNPFFSLIIILCGLVESAYCLGEADKAIRPNILLIVADDLGYTDIGPFGGEIATPNLDELAENGILMTNFYASLSCSPTRSMLMTGMDNHLVGLGNMAETLADNQVGKPGYEGRLNNRALTIAEQLREAGYHTYISGKWHLGDRHEHSARARGFERSFVLLYGAASHFDDGVGPDRHRPKALYREGGELVKELPKGFYSSRFYTDKLLEYIDESLDDEKPFFGYLAFTAPHWPLQAPEEYLKKYRGRYDIGYDQIRTQRFNALKEKGLIGNNVEIPPRPDFIPPWLALTNNERRSHARNMEVFAAMVDYLDMSIGRVLDFLKARGVYENTLVIFMSDNGADPWGLQSGPEGVIEFAKTFDQSVPMRGHKGSFSMYGSEWAHVGEAPFRLFKGYATEGGVRVPAILSWPKLSSGAAAVVHARASVKDVLPTVLEAAHSSRQARYYQARGKLVPDGKSMLPLLTQEASAIYREDDILGFEMWGRYALIKGDWKILHLPKPYGPDQWQLYNLKKDPGEQNDLSKAEPEILTLMLREWDNYQIKNNIVLPDGPLKIRAPEGKPIR